MDERPVVRYAEASDGVNLAYHITGEGPLDLLFMPSLAIPVDLLWDEPGFVRFAKRLGGFSRTIWCATRGVGTSGGNFIDFQVDSIVDADLTAVLDAAGCERTVLVTSGTGGAHLISFAAHHPNRVNALVLIDSFAHYVREDDYPVGIPPDALDRYVAALRERWGTTDVLAPSRAADESFGSWYLRCTRLGIPPEQGADAVVAGYKRDVRSLLPTLTVPTLVLHREGDRFIRVGAGRYLSDQIPGARYVELPGQDHLFFVGDTDAILDEIEEFLTGTHQAPEGDVVTATILFTDIVSSTEQSARMGHRKWNALTHDHDAMVRATLKRHRGREVKTTGDGFLATFDATTRAVRAAKEIVAAAKGIGIDVRAGVHTGEVEVRPDDVVGLAVTIAKRICDLAGPGRVLVSETVKGQLVGSGIPLSEEGTHILKGVPDEWRLFAVGSYMEAPKTRYVAVGDADVAYQVVGDGPLDLLFCYGLGSHIEYIWQVPPLAASLNRLAALFRLIIFDRRGTGASDAVPRNAVPTLEEWTDDMAAVLDAAHSERTAIFATLDTGPIGILYAAMHPERVSAVALLNTSARYIEADDYEIGIPPDAVDAVVEMMATSWGTPEFMALANPSADLEFLHLNSQLSRASSTPRTAAAQYDYMLRSNDVRQVLPLLQIPTLVLHVKDNPLVPVEHGRYLAEHIEGATFIEAPGGDLALTPANYWLIDEIAEFLTGERPMIEVDRILTTVLFTDIVGSTECAATLGDQKWRSLLDAHDRAVREQFRRFRGREINTTGDGFVASFDGPARAIRCAQAITEATGKLGVELRVGLHTGECEVRGDDLGGLAVHIAARVGALANPGEVLVSGTVKDLVVGSGIEFEDRSEHELKGVPGSWKLFAVGS